MARIQSKTELRYAENLAAGLRQARLAMGLGFRQAARMAEVDISTLYRIEQGQTTPSWETLNTLVRLYAVNVNLGPDGLMLTWLAEPEEVELVEAPD